MSSIVVLADLLENRELDSEATALVDGTDALSYGELRIVAGQVAASLQRAGLAPGDRVGVHLTKSVWSFATVHGVLRAGGVVVPIDPFAPVEYVASVLDAAGCAVLVTDARAANIARVAVASDVHTMIVRSDVEPTDSGDSVELVAWSSLTALEPLDPVERRPDDDAYIIFTSGSTGRPKGIVHTHASALAYARIAADQYGLGSDDRLANVASLHFDQSTFELYSAPLVGAAVIVVPDAVLRFPTSVGELVAREQATIWYSVPYVLRQLVSRGAIAEHDLSSIRFVLYGGEAYPTAELADLMRALPGATVSNVYGPAEVNQCMRHDLDSPPTSDAPVPIGRAWPHTEIVVVDSDLRPAPDGAGELLVSTTTMMDRYWDRPDLTAASIAERSFPGYEGERWYRTGDLVSTEPSGDVVFVGRVDNQVKIRGQRVELEAIDATIRSLPTVEEVAVVVRTDDAGERGLVAVIEAIDGGPGLREVQRKVADRHLRVAIPVALVVVASLVRTATGKVDRNAALDLATEPGHH